MPQETFNRIASQSEEKFKNQLKRVLKVEKSLG